MPLGLVKIARLIACFAHGLGSEIVDKFTDRGTMVFERKSDSL